MDRSIPPAGLPIGSSGSLSLHTLPLIIGRTQEQAVLREALATAFGGRGQLVLLSGEAGIGKTTLAQGVAREAAPASYVLNGHCYDLTNTPPYGPWLDLFAHAPHDPSLPMPPDALAGGTIAAITDQASLFADVRRYFAELSTGHPIVVLLEDLHWADPASLELLRHVAPHLRHWPILLLVTYRADELTWGHPLAQQLPALVREADGLRLDLHRLDTDALRTLVATRYRLATADEARLTAYLEQHAEGNPFFATELLRALEDDALLRPHGDEWGLGELDLVIVPPFLRQVIEGRVARLGEAVREPLAMAAVIGQQVPVALWAEVAALGDEMLLNIVERAVDAHLLAAERDGVHVRFVHALTREALYEGILPPRRRLWHQRVVDALMLGVSPDPDEVACHLERAGDSRAWEWLLKAADRAQRAYAWLTATERLQAAAAQLNGIAGQERTRGWLLYRAGRLQRYSQPELGIHDLAEAERLAHVAHDRALAAEARYSRGLLRCYADDFRFGLEDLAAGVTALEVLPVDEAFPSDTASAWFADSLPANAITEGADFDSGAIELSRLGMNHRRGTLPWFFADGGRLAEAQSIAADFLAHSERVPHVGELILSATGHAFQGLAISHAMLGRPDQSRAAFAQAREVYAALDHHAVIAFTLLNELEDVVLPYFTTDVAGRRRLAAEAEEALQRAGGALPADVSPRRAWLGVLFLEGQWAKAGTIAADTSTHGNYYLRRQVNCVLAQLARYLDEPERAWGHVRSSLPDGPATEPGSCLFTDALFYQRLAADLELDQGNPEAALSWLLANDRWIAWNHSVIDRACNRLVWARYYRESGDILRARDCAAEALRVGSEPDQPLARLSAHRLCGEIAGVERLADAEAHFSAALDLAAACTAPYERALTLLALAEVRLAGKQPATVSDLLAEVRAICVPLDARLTLHRVDQLMAALAIAPAPALPAGLTPREAEVLGLVAGGLTNADVAGRLSISERTVGQHLRTIYSKLDVSSRVGATRFAIDYGLV
jgi:DNA-binding CsgD family transcriptional regulator